MDIMIRDVDISTDTQGVREAHGSDEHWGSDESCFLSQKTRLENGFFIQVAICGDKVVGHAEWIISHEPEYIFLYLGMLHIHEDYQRRGIGVKFIESGIAYAKANNCAFVRTMPGIESGSFVFYQKNGFIQTKDINTTLKLETISAPTNNSVRIDKIPFSSVKTLPFVIGLYQHASAHMWNIYNARSENDDRTVHSYKIGGAYINIGAFEPNDHATVACWSAGITPALVTEILAIGGSLGYKYLSFCILSENITRFNIFSYEPAKDFDIFMELHF